MKLTSFEFLDPTSSNIENYRISPCVTLKKIDLGQCLMFILIDSRIRNCHPDQVRKNCLNRLII